MTHPTARKDTSQISRTGIRVEGIVQGVGFRPFVHGLAADLHLAGFVGNDARGVFVEIEGDAAAIERFVARLPHEAPPMAVIERVTTTPLDVRGEHTFTIVASATAGARAVPVSPDAAACAACLRDIADPTDRRHGYAFTNCTNCGPRYTIIRDVPYDRSTTTMARFAMCDACAAEYADPSDRRFHAQPVCCPTCGPALELTTADGDPIAGDPVDAAAALVTGGNVLALKGLGGYHLAVDATDDAAVARLRARKHREERPFAVMVTDLGMARDLCRVDDHEADLLSSVAAPIVLLRARGTPLAPTVAPGNRWLGLMLPYTPLHHLLATRLGRPFVLTSGNLSDEPIAYRDDDAQARLAGVADVFLAHDRPIHMRVDDSIVRLQRSHPMPLRRSRGYAPRPLESQWPFPRHLLACGAELKNTICLAKDTHAFVSHHIGDLENYETFTSFTGAITHLSRLFDVTPAAVAHDLHPEYLATKHALELDGVDLIGVQHHHAHIASCLADNDHPGPVIGVAFDGTGYGTDGTIWGGEILVADLERFERAGHLATVPLPGGAAAIREPWRMAASHLRSAYGDEVPAALAVRERHAGRWTEVLAVAQAGLNSPPTSSAGRLFDAAAALIGVRDTVTYEGQAAMELEQLADPAEAGAYDVGLDDAAPFVVSGADLIRAIVDDLGRDTPAPVVAARFHGGVASAIVAACGRVRERTGLTTVALSGGVFQNVLLVERTVTQLEARGFTVLTHRRVPPNDGGISFGQAAVAGARDRAAGR